MTNKRPNPLKDEPTAQLDELQELLAANLEAVETLNRNLCGHSDTKPIDPEALEKRIATAARNAVKELLENGSEVSSWRKKKPKHEAHSHRKSATRNFRQTMPTYCKNV